MRKIRLVLSIRSLDIGGAERQFIELVKNIDKNKFELLIITMYGGVLENEIKNFNYINLNKKNRYDLGFYFKYKKILKLYNADIIYSFLGEMNIFSYWCKPKNTKLIWGFRASNMDLKQYGKMSEILFFLQKFYSKKIDKIIANSNESIRFHKKMGFYMNKSVVIFNGINTKRFHKSDYYKNKLRKKYNIENNKIVIGIVARIDYMKGYIVFSKVAKRLLEENKDLFFVSIGDGNNSIKKECQSILNGNKNFLWLGKQKEIEKFYNILDISVSSSLFGEGFSNSIAEAMACEIPCVVTKVGDSEIIIGDTGVLVKPNDEEDLYLGIKKILKENLEKLGNRARNRVIQNFSIQKMVEKTQEEIIKCVE